MPSNLPLKRLLIAASAALASSVCLAYSNQSQASQHSLHHLLTSPTRRPGDAGVLRSVCVLGSNDHITCRDDDGTKPHQDEERTKPYRQGRPMMWTFLQVGTLLSCAYYYYMSGEEENDVKANQGIKSDTASSSTTSTQSSFINKCPIRERARQQGLVLYDGNWYPVAKFVPHHPGGSEVLTQYLGSDISFVFRVMHRNPDTIMKYRKPVRAATDEELMALCTRREEICHEMMEDHRMNCTDKTTTPSSLSNDSATKPFNLEAFEKDTMALYKQFENEGYFKPTLFWLIHKTALVLIFLSISIMGMKVSQSSTEFTTPILSYILPGIFLGLFWHQSGFLMHDAEHHNLVGNERINDILGWMYGTVFLGVNGAWWREEHREHHALLNTFDEDGFKDPQVGTIAQNAAGWCFSFLLNLLSIALHFYFSPTDERGHLDPTQETHSILRPRIDSFSGKLSTHTVPSNHLHRWAYRYHH